MLNSNNFIQVNSFTRNAKNSYYLLYLNYLTTQKDFKKYFNHIKANEM